MASFTVKPTGGLCNYLRVVFSYWIHCKASNLNLIVLWTITEECPGFFLDFFEPLEGVSFIKEWNPTLFISYQGNRWHPNYNPYEQFIYKGLQLLPTMNHILEHRRLLLGDYVALHIRRTDHTYLAQIHNSYTDDQEFTEFVKKYPNQTVYLSTDNRQTQEDYMAMFPNKIKYIQWIEPSESLRQTTLEEAILDLFLCIRASQFKGSSYSSFSGTIQQFREPTDSQNQFQSSLPY
jgi:hypothetical protein